MLEGGFDNGSYLRTTNEDTQIDKRARKSYFDAAYQTASPLRPAARIRT
jgi:hypothetical protein